MTSTLLYHEELDRRLDTRGGTAVGVRPLQRASVLVKGYEPCKHPTSQADTGHEAGLVARANTPKATRTAIAATGFWLDIGLLRTHSDDTSLKAFGAPPG